ncbi:hypothetical protein R3P38DRAFT_2812049 [Favolaschia claudopus]|uniref:Uncharacterized protein n=1 Tax=Favolaschia claudopus TaxID=2862362 RepID=A0AAV9Z8F7_9AGAR
MPRSDGKSEKIVEDRTVFYSVDDATGDLWDALFVHFCMDVSYIAHICDRATATNRSTTLHVSTEDQEEPGEKIMKGCTNLHLLVGWTCIVGDLLAPVVEMSTSIRVDSDNPYATFLVLRNMGTHRAFDLIDLRCYAAAQDTDGFDYFQPVRSERLDMLVVSGVNPFGLAPDRVQCVKTLRMFNLSNQLAWGQLKFVLTSCVSLVELEIAEVVCEGALGSGKLTLPALQILILDLSYVGAVGLAAILLLPAILSLTVRGNIDSPWNLLPTGTFLDVLRAVKQCRIGVEFYTEEIMSMVGELHSTQVLDVRLGNVALLDEITRSDGPGRPPLGCLRRWIVSCGMTYSRARTLFAWPGASVEAIYESTGDEEDEKFIEWKPSRHGLHVRHGPTGCSNTYYFSLTCLSDVLLHIERRVFQLQTRAINNGAKAQSRSRDKSRAIISTSSRLGTEMVIAIASRGKWRARSVNDGLESSQTTTMSSSVLDTTGKIASPYLQAEFPPEVEETIFFHALYRSGNSFKYDKERAPVVPECVTAILWSNVVVHPYMGRAHIRSVLTHVRLDTPDISLLLDTTTKASLRTALVGIVLILVAGVAERSTQITLRVSTHELVAILFNELSFSRVCDLRSLSCVSDETTQDLSADLLPAFGRLGSLRVLHLHGVVPTWTKAAAYASLTALYLSNVSNPLHRNTVRALLSASPVLATLQLSSVVFQTQYNEDELVDMTDIVAPRLTDVRLGFGLNPSQNFPSSFVLPMLNALHVRANPMRKWADIEPLCRDLLRVVQIFGMKQYRALSLIIRRRRV